MARATVAAAQAAAAAEAAAVVVGAAAAVASANLRGRRVAAAWVEERVAAVGEGAAVDWLVVVATAMVAAEAVTEKVEVVEVTAAFLSSVHIRNACHIPRHNVRI